MICLCYFSTATSPISNEALGDIIAHAQRKNAANGVTGLLCHYDGSFLQFLEGEVAQVRATFAAISSDPRHRDILEVYREPIDQRLFGAWSMAVVKPDALGAAPQAFSMNLRQLELRGDAAHRKALEPFLEAFRAWIR